MYGSKMWVIHEVKKDPASVRSAVQKETRDIKQEAICPQYVPDLPAHHVPSVPVPPPRDANVRAPRAL